VSGYGWAQEVGTEFRRRRAQFVAGAAYVLLAAGALWLVSAIGKDSHQWYDTVEQSTNAAVGVVLLGVALPFGGAALLIDRRDVREYAPGEKPLRLRHPRWLIAAMALAVLAMTVVTAILLGWRV
jgi:hypothetical protein